MSRPRLQAALLLLALGFWPALARQATATAPAGGAAYPVDGELLWRRHPAERRQGLAGPLFARTRARLHAAADTPFWTHFPLWPAADRRILLDFAASITNWDAVKAARQLQGWTECTASECMNTCAWSGILCGGADGNQIIQL